jgi:hypothetical protein
LATTATIVGTLSDIESTVDVGLKLIEHTTNCRLVVGSYPISRSMGQVFEAIKLPARGVDEVDPVLEGHVAGGFPKQDEIGL